MAFIIVQIPEKYTKKEIVLTLLGKLMMSLSIWIESTIAS